MLAAHHLMKTMGAGRAGHGDAGRISAAPGASDTVHGEANIAHGYVLIRVLAQIQTLVAAIATYPHHRPLYAGLVLIAGQIAHTVAISAVVLIRHRMPPAWLTVLDVAALAGELVVGGFISAPGYGDTWAYFVYPYSLIAIIGAGLAVRRLPAVLALASAPAVAYGLVNVSMLGEAPWNAVLDSLPYLLHSGVAWGVARALRRSSHRVDVAHQRLTGREVELARAKERARHARILHDRVLQTLEILSQGDFVTDPTLRGHIRAEASWLRAFVRDDPDDAATELLAALTAVAQDLGRAGLAVQVNTAQLAEALSSRAGPEAATTRALADAAREALMNVLKHAGTQAAVLHAELTAGALTVSVLDHGRGFDRHAQPPGFGITTSIRGRITAVGGEVSLDSRPGAGTYVELRVPVPVAPGPAEMTAEGHRPL